MQLSSAIIISVLSVSTAVAVTTNHHRNTNLSALARRPIILPAPYTHGNPIPISPERGKICYVNAGGVGQDDSQSILSAFTECNNGGTVALLDPQYFVAQPLDLTFLDSVDFVIQGEISFSPNVEFWASNSFKYAFQGAALFWQIGGRDVNIYGGGTINGNGQAWWDVLPTNSTMVRPILIGIIGLHGGTISNLNLINPPNWFHFVANSTDLIFDSMSMTAISNNTNPAANSDGWDLYRSDSIIVQNSVVLNDDDCVSFKPNSTNTVVQNMQCTNSHGISVGSLGEYVGEVDIVENLYIFNATMTTSGDGARIKVYGGIPPTSTSLSSGGGTGYVRNVTYNEIHDVSDDYAIELTQCYGQSNITACNLYPSGVTISDVWFLNFTGTASSHYNPIVGTLVCSTPDACTNIFAENINITTSSGSVAEWTCTNVNETDLAINCVS